MSQIADQLIEMYISRFINRTDTYYEQWANQSTSKNGYARRNEAVTTQLVRSHLAGSITCAWTALNTDGLCKWCAWDEDGEYGYLNKLEPALTGLGLNPLRESSRTGRAGHLWLLLDAPIPAADLIRFDKGLRIRLLLPETFEFFPKQAQAQFGNALRGPLGVNLKPEANGAIGWFDGPPKEVGAQLEWLAVQPLTSSAKITAMVKKLRAEDAERERYKFVPILPARQSASTKELLSLLELARLHGQNLKQVSKGHTTRCPACAAAGCDRKGNNLFIGESGFSCQRGCDTKSIYRCWMI